jgi:transposase
MLDYNMLFRWFLDMNLEERSFDHSSFSKNRSRLIEHDIAKGFFAGAVKQAKAQGLLSVRPLYYANTRSCDPSAAEYS